VTGSNRMCESVGVQDALDRCATGWLNAEPFQLRLNGCWANQTVTRFWRGSRFQGSPNRDDGLLNFLRRLRR
jgi:hypothetical protein